MHILFFVFTDRLILFQKYDRIAAFEKYSVLYKSRNCKTETNDKIEAIINWLLGKMILIILLSIYIIIFTDAMRQGNWNEQYSRKKNVKIYNMPENRGEKLPVSLINQLKEKLDINIDRSDIV
jgi:hypothetical protein